MKQFGRLVLMYPINGRMAIGLLLALVLICFNMILSYLSVDRLIDQNRNLTHGYEVLAAARTTLTSLQEVENSQREYLITGDRDYLLPYYQGVDKLNEHLKELKLLVIDSRIGVLLPELEAHITKRLALGQEGIRLRQAGRFEDAQHQVRQGRGKQEMVELRRLLGQIISYENSLLNLSQHAAQNSALQALLTLTVASLANLALLLLVYRMLARDIVRRQETEAVLRASEADLKASEARKSAILATSLDCIISIDEHNHIIEWNPAAEATFGYTRAEAIGSYLPELVVPPDQRQHQLEGISRYMAALQNHMLGERIEVISIRRDGSEFPAELAVTRIETESGPMFTAYLRDITQRKLIEQALHEALDGAEAANRTKGMFLANMSHELRTPLNVILGYAELLEEEAEEEERSGLIKDLYKIRHAGHHLLTLINQVLDLSKIEAGKMEVYAEEFELDTLIREISETVRLLMEQNGNVLMLHCQPELGRMHSDPLKIRQVLLNLLSNAAKFTQQGTVTLEALREFGESEDWILFCVTDTGIGIAPEQMGKLFEPFTQADPTTTREYGGTGLGLALSRHFCYMLGGEVTVSSVPGEGSSFTIRLPAKWVSQSQLELPLDTEQEALEVQAPSEQREAIDESNPAWMSAEANC
ncbi:MAG: hypothetical protein CVV27_06645 [Candidatus Melainabacteria bacterium HGW-Melainabacteria-1]|nr:MAG: hypothetical protein CVV27_06645 [Candidatus Melainabacteria bacterium HGW-Melainabacteria-1]